jgi:hypothetical protein
MIALLKSSYTHLPRIVKNASHLIINVTETESLPHEKMLPKIDEILAFEHSPEKRERLECLSANHRKSI